MDRAHRPNLPRLTPWANRCQAWPSACRGTLKWRTGCEGILAGVDWHFYVFRHQNALAAVQFTVMILDHLVSILDRVARNSPSANHLPKTQWMPSFAPTNRLRLCLSCSEPRNNCDANPRFVYDLG